MRNRCPRSLVILNAPRNSDCPDIFSDMSCVFIAKPALLCFLPVQTASSPRLGVLPCCKEKFSCLFIERRRLWGKRFQSSLPKPAESTGLWPQLANRKFIQICLCSLAFFQWRRSLTLRVSDQPLLTLFFFFFILLSCGIQKIFYVKLKEISAENCHNNCPISCIQICLSWETQNQSGLKKNKARVTETSRASEAHEDKLDQAEDVQMRLSPQIQDNACSRTNSTHSLFSPSPLEKRSSTLLLCYSCQWLVLTWPQTNPAHFLPEAKLVKQSYRYSVCPTPSEISPSLSSPPLASAPVKGPITGSLRHVRSRTPVSKELETAMLYSPLGPRINFTERSGSVEMQAVLMPETCQQTSKCVTATSLSSI